MDVYAKQPACIREFMTEVNKAGVKMAEKLNQHERALSNLTRAKAEGIAKGGCQDDECDMSIDTFLDKFGFSEAEVARALGVQPQIVQNWKKAVQPIVVRVGLRQQTVEIIRTESKIKTCILPDIGAGI